MSEGMFGHKINLLTDARSLINDCRTLDGNPGETNTCGSVIYPIKGNSARHGDGRR